jgi:D-beta-D-heptose 7-phosphate kinase/D-beta-D-heptose 1-phosphate adenosyltransferase
LAYFIWGNKCMLQNMKSFIPKDVFALKNTRIFIAGDAILDIYVEGKVNRISPEAPVPVMLETHRKEVPGGACNVAANVASMGARAYLCARIGRDSYGESLKRILRSFSIATKGLLVSDQKNVPTTTKMRIVSGNMLSATAQQIVRIDKEFPSPVSLKEEDMICDLYQEFLNQGGNRCLVLSDYGKGFLTKSLLSRLIFLSKKYSVPVVTDPKNDEVSRYAGSTVIKPNLSEGRSVLRILKPGNAFASMDEELENIASCYLNASGCENIVMSLSEHGVLIKGKDLNQTLKIKTHALQIADVSGAGDTLISFLAMALAAQLPLFKATELGNLAAGIVCGKLGTATVSIGEFLEFFKMRTEAIHPEKLMNLESLIPLVQDLKVQKKRIVFTNGCFDILHAGHVDYLQKARALGDLLIVGLNSDQSVSQLKGPSRPVQPARDRSSILAALACVDYVVIFEELTPLEVIVKLQPDILVKGSDYHLENTVGAHEVLAWGGTVEHLPLLPGRSTTSILQKAQRTRQS